MAALLNHKQGLSERFTKCLQRLTKQKTSTTPPLPRKEIDGGHRRPNRRGIKIAKSFYVIYGNNLMSAQVLEVSILGVGTVLRLETDACVVGGQITKASNK